MPRLTDHPSPIEPGMRLGRYEVLAKVSSGGMADLFLAYIPGPGGFRKFVAVKRILPSLRAEEEFVTMFLDEARISASMSHANIAQVFELSEDAGELFLAMEYIAGQDLRRVFTAAHELGTRLPVPFSAAVIRDACIALHYAHAFASPGGRPLPVIHRDVSPRNIMVTYTGCTKVIDFGIAKARGCLTQTEVGRVKGNPSYMSPEQIRGEPLDGRADLFSAAVILYEALTGTRPFRADDQAATFFRILNHDVPPPHELNSEVPPRLSDVVLKALAKNPSERFATARDMARAIVAAVTESFREEECAAVMASLFANAIDKTSALLALAADTDTGRIRALADSLAQQGAGSGSHSVQFRETKTVAQPRVDSNEPALDLPVAAPAPSAQTSGFVLAVDDSHVGRQVLERLLKHAGYEVIGASSAKEALALIAEFRPDAIVLDVMMPEVDGFELSRRIRELPDFRFTPILFVSAACSLEERVKGLSVGGDDFIRKPFEAADLLARIRVHLQRARSIKQSLPPEAPPGKAQGFDG